MICAKRRSDNHFQLSLNLQINWVSPQVKDRIQPRIQPVVPTAQPSAMLLIAWLSAVLVWLLFVKTNWIKSIKSQNFKMALVRLKNYCHPTKLIRSISSHVEEKSFGLTSSEKTLERNLNYQFLQDSPVSSDYFQPSLFRLPIPKLEESCARYLATQKQLLSQEQYLCTEEKVKAFLSNEG